ncbi:hypothetical protein EV360DRAFT_74591, partial [Lentinula raphanica]
MHKALVLPAPFTLFIFSVFFARSYITFFRQSNMDHMQWMQQSLQAMFANNPQLFIQMLQQNQTPSVASSHSSASTAQLPHLPVASAPSPAPAPLPAAPAPAPLPLLAASNFAPTAAPNPAPLTATPNSAPLTAALNPAPLTAAPNPAPLTAAPNPAPLMAAPNPAPSVAAAPPNHSFPQAMTLAALSNTSPSSDSQPQSQAIQPISSYVSPLSMLSSVTARTNDSGPSRSSSSSAPSSFPQSITAIQQANRDRLGHAASTLHQTTTAPKKKRGPGKKAPRLNAAIESPKIEDAVAVANDGTQVISLVVLVYPPRLTPDECMTYGLPVELHHYLQNRDAFQFVLDSLSLLHRFDNLPLDTKVVDLLEALHSSLVRNGWIFPESQDVSPFFNRHERLAIQLLRFTGKGNINNNAKTPRLITGKVESEEMTL